jgi:hypothetical protein
LFDRKRQLLSRLIQAQANLPLLGRLSAEKDE